ncbi:hypothetical protein CGJ43_24980, partial [Vibrio parahaemolyticus]|uniref:hypothetical protein n=1 Tax=Vibrio parahaemolyticus TaxID=670 RepID=UPI00116F04D5
RKRVAHVGKGLSLARMSSEIFNQAFESLSNKNSKMNVSVSELMGMNWHEMSYMIERFNNVNKQTK